MSGPDFDRQMRQAQHAYDNMEDPRCAGPDEDREPEPMQEPDEDMDEGG